MVLDASMAYVRGTIQLSEYCDPRTSMMVPECASGQPSKQRKLVRQAGPMQRGQARA